MGNLGLHIWQGRFDPPTRQLITSHGQLGFQSWNGWPLPLENVNLSGKVLSTRRIVKSMQRYTKLQVYLARNESTCLACSCFFRALVQNRYQWFQKNDLYPPKNFKKSRDLLVIYFWTIRCAQTPWKVWYFKFVYLVLQAWGASLILAVIIAPEIFNSEQTKPKLTPF